MLSGIVEFPVSNRGPNDITAGPDGNLWFTDYAETEPGANRIRQMTTAGVITGEFLVDPLPSKPYGIVVGPDHNLWFTEILGNNIRVMSPDGTVLHRFPVEASGTNLSHITVGPDNNSLWFTEDEGNLVGKITLNGEMITRLLLPTSHARPFGITAGPDGNVWFAESGFRFDNIGKIGRVNLDHDPVDITDFTVGLGTDPESITTGPDGNLWFAEGGRGGGRIGRITPEGGITEFSNGLTPGSRPYRITAGPDGNLWFTEVDGSRIGRITPDGVISEFQTPTPNSQPYGITTGPDGELWLTEYAGHNIGKMYLLTAAGTSLTATAGQPLYAVAATFHDEEPGMLGSNYQVTINWGDNSSSGGQAWTQGSSNWVATGSHTYDTPGQYDVTVTIADHRSEHGMTTSTVSHVSVDGPSAPSRRFFIAALVSQQVTPVAVNHTRPEGALFRDVAPASAAVRSASRSLGSLAVPVPDSVIDLLHSHRAVSELPALLDPFGPDVVDMLALNLLPR